MSPEAAAAAPHRGAGRCARGRSRHRGAVRGALARRGIALCALLSATPPAPLAAETRATIAGRPEYDTSAFHDLWFGDGYRKLWTMPIELEVLDLGAVAGGLTPVRRVGSFQSLVLVLAAADGSSYSFRVLDKNPEQMLPPEWRESLPADVLQDQTAMSHPGGALVASGLAEAAGVPHTEPRFVVMPDAPELGELRALFGGRAGNLYEYPLPASESHAGFAGATEILDTEELWARWLAGEGWIDRRALLRARLLDVLIGDWDRHADQWRWMRVPGAAALQPLPEDRDQAFSDYAGLLADWARTWHPQFLQWEPRYGNMEGLLYQGREVDRWHLAALERPAFLATARELQAALTDDAIDSAVSRLPGPWLEANGAELARILRARRDRLREAAHAYYEHLARAVDVQGTDRDDEAALEWRADGSAHLTLALAGADAPYLERVFRPDETDEIRIYLRGGDDRYVSSGQAGGITVRVSAGPGRDRLDDDAGGTRFYDVDASDEVGAGRDTSVVRRGWDAPPYKPTTPWLPQRDHGTRTPVLPLAWWEPDPGMVLSLTATHYRYGFRKLPYAQRHAVGVQFKTGRSALRVSYGSDLYWSIPGFHTEIEAYGDGAKNYNFYGFGNETAGDAPEGFFEADQEELYLYTTLLAWESGSRRFRVGAGPELQLSRTAGPADTLIARTRPRGFDDFGRIGVRASLRFEARGRRAPRTRSVLGDLESGASDTNLALALDGSWSPEAWDVESGFGSVEGVLAGTWQASGWLSLAARAGGRRVWGPYPWYEAAFLGGQEDLRGYDRNRFAGDGALFASAEVRLTLGQIRFPVPARCGVLGLADVGRVWLEGESSNRWHAGYGGGVFLRLLGLGSVVQASVAQGDGLRVYLGYGFSF